LREVLSQNIERPLDIPNESLRRFPGREGTPVEAAVLVPIVMRPEGLTVLLTQRSAHLNDHAGQVSFPGLIDDVRPLLAACDIGYVLSYQEALSFACRELMALGLPVLVTRVGGLPENLTDQREGWIVPPRSPELIKNVLQKILLQPEQLPQMGAQARRRAEREFGLTDFVKATLAIYQ
jgi:glycosyltransferase involved in cell wall biosynthesis